MSRAGDLIAIIYAVRHVNRHACQDRAARDRGRRTWRRSRKNANRSNRKGGTR